MGTKHAHVLRKSTLAYVLFTITSYVNIELNFLPFFTLHGTNMPGFVLHVWDNLECNKTTRVKYQLAELLIHISCVNLRSMCFYWNVVFYNPFSLQIQYSAAVIIYIHQTHPSIANMQIEGQNK